MNKFLTILILIIISMALYGKGNYENKIYREGDGPAVEGYDTVAYFEDSKQTLGLEKWETEYKGAQWLFSSEKNRDLFLKDPGKYTPAYGGYCAWAMSEGKLAPGRAEHWDIIDGRLFLNYSSSTRKKFLKDINVMIYDADRQWPFVEEKLYEVL